MRSEDFWGDSGSDKLTTMVLCLLQAQKESLLSEVQERMSSQKSVWVDCAFS